VRILALETSSASGSAATLENTTLVRQLHLPEGQRSAQSLAPTVASVLAESGWRPQDVQLVAVTQGPGSFTGLRVGATTAKTLAYAVGAAILGINTLETVAAQAPQECGEIWTLLDAYRGEWFSARYRLRSGTPEEIEPTSIAPLDDWLRRYAPENFVTALARMKSRLPPRAAVVSSDLWTPQAATVGRLAALHYAQGRRDDVWSFAPNYFRPSAAEEKQSL
jgi:tRNA threonylcarbamoyladenosine biosynthesis protein TsaB